MTRTAAPFRQADVTRAVRGARAGGLEVAKVRIVNGEIEIIATTGAAVKSGDAATETTGFDEWKAKHPDAG
jgi:hypothetical protein